MNHTLRTARLWTASLCTAALLLGGCASRDEDKHLRLNLGEGQTLEMRLPPAWSATASTELVDGTPRLALVRLSSRVGETPQLRLIPRVEARARQVPTATEIEQRARTELARSGECQGVSSEVQRRMVPSGVAVFCSRPAGAVRESTLLPVTAGVVASERLSVRFAVLDAGDEVAAAAWAIVGSLRYSNVSHAPR